MKQKEITRTREEGTEVTATCQFPDPGAARIDAIRRIVERCQYAKVDGVMVDLFSASAIVKVHDALNEQNRLLFRGLSVTKMANVAFKLMK